MKNVVDRNSNVSFFRIKGEGIIYFNKIFFYWLHADGLIKKHYFHHHQQLLFMGRRLLARMEDFMRYTASRST